MTCNYFLNENLKNSIKDINCLFIDFDGTLVDYHQAEYLALEYLLKKYGVENKEDAIADYRQKNQELWEDFEQGTITIPEIQDRRFFYLLEKYKIHTVTPREFNDLYLDNFIKFTTIEGDFVDELKRLKENGYTLIVVSNGIERIQKARLANTGIDQIVHGYVTSEAVGMAKPGTKIFDAALKLAQGVDQSINKEHIIMLGDSYSADIMGSVRWQIPVVWINPGLCRDGQIMLPKLISSVDLDNIDVISKDFSTFTSLL